MRMMKRKVRLLVVLGIILGGFVPCSKEKLDAPKKNIPKNLLSIKEVKGIELEQETPCSLAMYGSKEEARENLTPIYLIEGTEPKSISFSFETNEGARIKCVEPVDEERKTMERRYAGAYLIDQKDDSQDFSLDFPDQLEEGSKIVYQIEIYFNRYKYFAFEAMQDL